MKHFVCLLTISMPLICTSLNKALAAPLRVSGSTTVAPVIAAASEGLLPKTLQVIVDTQGGSMGGLLALKSGDADVAMTSSDFTADNRNLFGTQPVIALEIGKDSLALAVTQDVYDIGIKSLKIEDIKKIYESKVTNWKELQGTNAPIAFFNKEMGRGTLEAFLGFVYGNAKNAPQSKHPVIGSNQEAVTRLHKGKHMMTILSHAWIGKSPNIRAISIVTKNKQGQETAIGPDIANIRNGSYPFVRPLNLIAKLPLSADVAQLFERVKSSEFRKLVEEQGFVSNAPLAQK